MNLKPDFLTILCTMLWFYTGLFAAYLSFKTAIKKGYFTILDCIFIFLLIDLGLLSLVIVLFFDYGFKISSWFENKFNTKFYFKNEE